MRGALPAIAMAAILASSAMSAFSAAQSKPEQHGRLFPPTDLGLLELPDRDLWQLPEQIMDVLGIAEGSVVADVGAGSGWFTIRLARRVGPNGAVYAVDVQPEMLAAISRRVQREGLANVHPTRGSETDPRLPRARLDATLIVITYNEIRDKITMLRNLATALKPQGRIGIVDFKLEGGGPGPPMDERVDPRIVVRDAAAAGLQLVSEETFLPYQYCLVFSKAAASTSKPTAGSRSRGRP